MVNKPPHTLVSFQAHGNRRIFATPGKNATEIIVHSAAHADRVCAGQIAARISGSLVKA